ILTCPDDDPVVYTALAGAADVICTVDRHFYEPNVLQFCSRFGIRIMDDVELLTPCPSPGDLTARHTAQPGCLQRRRTTCQVRRSYRSL
ncbi:MAG: hypothetical protein WA746_25280, partial [Isosphaeraceae bacterium]